jgi:hypothetical protein
MQQMDRRPSAALSMAVVLIGIAVAPLSLRALNAAVAGELPPLGYLPSLQIRRTHQPFNEDAIGQLRYGNPAWVFIGDSMLGSRIDPLHLGRISGTQDEIVSFLFHPATGPAWWYLAFKNHLLPSGVRPRATFIFFRDTNLTDTLFRLEPAYGAALDLVARPPVERELDAVVSQRRRGAWHQLHDALSRLYQSDYAASWMEPGLRRWFVHRQRRSPAAVEAFEHQLYETFYIDNLRYDVAADMVAEENPDFHRDLPTSVLPLIADLAKQHGLTVCFVRVQRRPIGGQPPEQSDPLVRYVADLRQWLDRNGMLFHDDTGDPEMTLDLYADGDHVGNRRAYTDIFRRRLDPLFRPLTTPRAP